MHHVLISNCKRPYLQVPTVRVYINAPWKQPAVVLIYSACRLPCVYTQTRMYLFLLIISVLSSLCLVAHRMPATNDGRGPLAPRPVGNACDQAQYGFVPAGSSSVGWALPCPILDPWISPSAEQLTDCLGVAGIC
jgi:hypothetical protein